MKTDITSPARLGRKAAFSPDFIQELKVYVLHAYLFWHNTYRDSPPLVLFSEKCKFPEADIWDETRILPFISPHVF
jgi:hypothetical protein